MNKDLVTIELDKYNSLLNTVDQIKEFKSNDDYLVLEYYALGNRVINIIKNKEAAITNIVYAKEHQIHQLERRIECLKKENENFRKLKTPDKPWYKRLFKTE